jgi:hypothetical protein
MTGLLHYCYVLSLQQKHACLRSHYLAMAVVGLLVSWSLPSNGSTCHNMFSVPDNRLLQTSIRCSSQVWWNLHSKSLLIPQFHTIISYDYEESWLKVYMRKDSLNRKVDKNILSPMLLRNCFQRCWTPTVNSLQIE